MRWLFEEALCDVYKYCISTTRISPDDTEKGGKHCSVSHKIAAGLRASTEVAELENQIKDRVAQSCNSNGLRYKLLEKEDTLTLAEAVTIAVSFEVMETQFQTMRLDGGSHVNKVTSTDSSKGHGHGIPKLKMTVNVLDMGILDILARIQMWQGFKEFKCAKILFAKKCRTPSKPKRDD